MERVRGNPSTSIRIEDTTIPSGSANRTRSVGFALYVHVPGSGYKTSPVGGFASATAGGPDAPDAGATVMLATATTKAPKARNARTERAGRSE